MIEAMKISEEHINPLFTYTLSTEHEHVLGCAGLRLIWDGVWEGWFQGAAPHIAHRYRFMVVRFVKRYLNRMLNECHRIQAVVCSDDMVARRFVLFLGFEREGVLRKYGPDGRDYIMYSKVN
jgi:hypothetical protein